MIALLACGCIVLLALKPSLGGVVASRAHSDKEKAKGKGKWDGMSVGGIVPHVRPLEPNCTAPPRQVFILHIPKTGGTSLCGHMKKTGACVAESYPSWGNCWVVTDGPEWCCDKVKPLLAYGQVEKTCTERRKYPAAYTMSERYMDTDPTTGRTLFCEGITYGVLVRDAVGRATSMLHHYLTKWPTKKSGPSELYAYREALAALFVTRPPKQVQEFFDLLDTLPPFSAASRRLVNHTFASVPMPPQLATAMAGGVEGATQYFFQYSEDLERHAYFVNAFTSNYLVRMLLGKQLGDEPLLASSLAINTAALENAKWAMDQFHFVLHSESLSTEAAAGIEETVFQSRVQVTDNRAEHDEFYELLLGPDFAPWLARRNQHDINIVNSIDDRLLPNWKG